MADPAVVEAIGLIAGALTTLAFVPQVLKVRRSGQTRDISLTMFLVFCCGVALWLGYGVLINSLPVILANAVTLLLAGAILAMKLRNVLRGERDP